MNPMKHLHTYQTFPAVDGLFSPSPVLDVILSFSGKQLFGVRHIRSYESRELLEDRIQIR